MKVETMQTISSSYQSQGSASVTAPVTGVNPIPVQKTDVGQGSRSGVEFGDALVSSVGSIRENGQASNEQIRQAVEAINKNSHNGEAVFGIHEETNRVTIKIVDKETKEVIKEFPPEKTLDMIAKVWEMAGIMVDERR